MARTRMGEEYGPANWERLVELRAPLPFGHRVLVPWLTRPVLDMGVSIRDAFTGWEAVATFALVLGTAWAVRPYMSRRWAMLGGVALLLMLPLPFLVRHRWPIFYPWDTPGMAFVVWGVGALLRGRMRTALAIVAVGALNREGVLLLAPAALLLWPRSVPEARRALAWAVLLFATHWAVRQGIALALPDNPGPPIHFTIDERYRLFTNFEWLADPWHAIRFLASLSFLPLVWVVLWLDIPHPLRRLHVLAMVMLCALLVVANAYEPRAFGEWIVLSWVVLFVGVHRRIEGRTPDPACLDDRSRWLRWFDALAAPMIVLAFVGFAWALGRWSFLPIAQWPMP